MAVGTLKLQFVSVSPLEVQLEGTVKDTGDNPLVREVYLFQSNGMVLIERKYSEADGSFSFSMNENSNRPLCVVVKGATGENSEIIDYLTF